MWSTLGRFLPKVPTVNAVFLKGVIKGGRGRGGISFDEIEPVLKAAFRKGVHPPEAVALIVNSPGGSPVQSSLIGQRIQELANETKIPVVSFAEDVAASGGYWLLCAGEEIYADRSSIVGSIGVVSGGFGFVETLPRLGMERRLYTSGTCKARLDPFKPAKKEDVDHLQDTLEEIHTHFKAYVSERRGDRIKGEEEMVFNGDFFTGEQGLKHGLVDKIGHLHGWASEKKLKIKYMNPRRFVFPWDAAAGGSLGESLITTMMDEVEARYQEKLLLSRIGL